MNVAKAQLDGLEALDPYWLDPAITEHDARACSKTRRSPKRPAPKAAAKPAAK